ncbi:hypothetical protein COCSUDRAFT_52546 [Coccomyxa subellipsoidea C-169]|uniref:Uncharacterized protein n=1 Tax=Coccomyxa subellipsoidea (strain C-169) TaxID=574566 RepID=I0Z4Y8_COCSC|nr:hypothetical protein COCSUDRAFT_52546 [Coccomyxa subellipsoidea C-169]EIE25707.1 hypothetical protein COCSUDRAFT_52546 [Coccomyxa subellipsoidea C-169]|eukprot:XP_005650251.1 hypothetical protein COCSUDRAFT_52546 [Coccomyxa subellipsoidea C-169]
MVKQLGNGTICTGQSERAAAAAEPESHRRAGQNPARLDQPQPERRSRRSRPFRAAPQHDCSGPISHTSLQETGSQHWRCHCPRHAVCPARDRPVELPQQQMLRSEEASQRRFSCAAGNKCHDHSASKPKWHHPSIRSRPCSDCEAPCKRHLLSCSDWRPRGRVIQMRHFLLKGKLRPADRPGQAADN